ncbi:phenylacetate--CoA ligase family protein [Williamsia phyllosphaerae]|uniref:phenylacetate--CoA ligase family protein n=1 Tax=Williamsia phyllosphaerae TaxID=885042 RepID=UPI00166D1581|nr:phenylacetate--CoA ligase family protein [Williamsia phyllosphaerae]
MVRGYGGGRQPDDLDRSGRWLRRDARRAAAGTLHDIDARASRRLRRLVAHAQSDSPLFAELYRGIDPDSVTIEDLPITHKASLMAELDRWCTDRRITVDALDAFVREDAPVGTRFLGEFLYSETSGTTGIPGRFVTEDAALAVVDSLGFRVPRPSLRAIARAVRKHGRTVEIVSIDGHHMGPPRYHNQQNGPNPRSLRLSVLDPIAQIARAVDDFDPVTIGGYSSILGALAAEQLAGRLHTEPAVLMPISESMTPEVRALMDRAWPDAQIIDRYVATEAMFIAARCRSGWHHLNSDWIILEPIDADGRPTPTGEVSHSTLLTTLNRRVQPIIRYTMGDAILVRPDPCECGSALTAFEIHGRSGELISFHTAAGRTLISPLALSVLLSHIPGVWQLQVVRDAPTHITVRLSTTPGADPAASGRDATRALRDFLDAAGLRSVDVELGSEAPQRTPGGKFLRVVDLVGGPRR